MLTISEILAIADDPNDILLSNGYIEKGAPFVFCGPPGIGKSRIAMQLAIHSVLSQDFLNKWSTNTAGMRWAFLQNENGNRRLKSDLVHMVASLSAAQRKMLDENILIHCIVTDLDGHLDLSDHEALKRVREVVQDWKPHIVIGDPLTAFGVGDLNADKDMMATARGFGRVVREGDPRRTPGLLHHARTGKEAIQGLSGYDRSSFGRNSKALFGWTRSQFNMAAANETDSDRLFFASGKCNNFREFDEFIIGLDTGTMFYSPTGDDPKTVREDLMGDKNKQRKKQYHIGQILAAMSKNVPRTHGQIMGEVCELPGRGKKNATGMSVRTFNNLWGDAKTLSKIKEAPHDPDKWIIA